MPAGTRGAIAFTNERRLLCAVARDAAFRRRARVQKRRRGPMYEAKLTAVPERCCRESSGSNIDLSPDRRRLPRSMLCAVSRSLWFGGTAAVASRFLLGVLQTSFLEIFFVPMHFVHAVFDFVFGKPLSCRKLFRSMQFVRHTAVLLIGKQERKRALMENADCIIALPGGLGTWDELWEMVCLKGIGKREEQEALTKRARFRFLPLQQGHSLESLFLHPSAVLGFSGIYERRMYVRRQRVWAVLRDVFQMLSRRPPCISPY